MENETPLSVPSEPIEENDHGWQKVTHKKQRKNPIKATSDTSKAVASGSGVSPENNTVFKSLEKNAEVRRRKLEDERAAAAAIYHNVITESSRRNWGDSDDDDEIDADVNVTQNTAVANKKEKPKKVKKPKVTVAEAAAKIEASDLVEFLSGVTESYEGNEEIQLTMFADYFRRSFSAVSASEFAWVKKFRESTVDKIAHVPISDIPMAVYKTSADWIDHRSIKSLGNFVLLSLDSILADLATQQPGAKGGKKGGQNAASKSQVAMFLVLAVVLRRKPEVLIHLLPKLRENSKYQGQDKLTVMVWMAVQASQGDLAIGLYLWAHQILPILGAKSGSNPQSRDLVLQLVERIISTPKARGILVNSAVRKGERLVPPAALDLLLHLTFPASSARVKSTERFEAVYPVLKDVALAGSPGSKAMKQVLQQILTLALKAIGEGVPELSREASSIFIWSLTQNPDSWESNPHRDQGWDKLYLDNLEASVAIIKKLGEEWDELSFNESSLEELYVTIARFLIKNDKAKDSGAYAARQALFDDSNKYCKLLLRKLSSGRGDSCVKFLAPMAFIALLFATGAAFISSNRDYSWDWNNLAGFFNAR